MISKDKSALFRHSILPWCLALLLSYLPHNTYANESQTISWDELVPSDWDPNSVFDGYTNDEIADMSDDQYYELQERAQELFDAAPTVDELDGRNVKIPGFVLPLEFAGTNVKEFLLVPYFGACVHTPPPPANQIIHGKLETSFATNEFFEPVWITGELKVARSTQVLGEQGVDLNLDIETGYTMSVQKIEPYEEEE